MKKFILFSFLLTGCLSAPTQHHVHYSVDGFNETMMAAPMQTPAQQAECNSLLNKQNIEVVLAAVAGGLGGASGGGVALLEQQPTQTNAIRAGEVTVGVVGLGMGLLSSMLTGFQGATGNLYTHECTLAP